MRVAADTNCKMPATEEHSVRTSRLIVTSHKFTSWGMNKAVVDSRLVVHGGHDGNKWVADMHILAAWPVTRFELPGYASYIQEDGRDGEREREILPFLFETWVDRRHCLGGVLSSLMPHRATAGGA